MYSFRILFFCLPLYFSHVFAPFGLVIGESYSFERYKVYLFFILLIIVYLEGLIRYGYHIYNIFRKYGFSILMFLIIPIVSGLYFSIPFDIDWLLGSHEKHHGYIFYIGIIAMMPLLLMSTREHLRSYLSWSIYAAVIVALIAIGEYIGAIWDIYGRSEIDFAYSGRSLSTLGNPNYLAGYLLIILPLVAQWRSPERWILIGLFAWAIVTTGSYIGIFLMGVYILYIYLRYLNISKIVSLYSTGVVMICSCIVGYYFLDSDKLLSLLSRFILMRESLAMMIGDPLSFLIGFGPDSLISHFSQERSLIVNSYFPSNMLIDSSHNIFIDLLFQYGIIPLVLIGSFCYQYCSNQKEELQIAVLLGCIFLAFNVFVLVHILLLALVWSIFYRSSQNKVLA